jgi:hypothetical protein
MMPRKPDIQFEFLEALTVNLLLVGCRFVWACDQEFSDADAEVSDYPAD